MANRRMFAKTVVCDDAFRELPPAAQTLYFQIGMEADDDGFCASVKGIMRLCGCKAKDLQTLIDSGYIWRVNERLFFVVHWVQNNFLQSDRYKETTHKSEKSELTRIRPDLFREFSQKTKDKSKKIESTKSSEKCIQDVYRMESQVSIGKNSIDSTLSYSPPSIDNRGNSTQSEFDVFYSQYPTKEDKEKAREVWDKLSSSGKLPSHDDLYRRKAKDNLVAHGNSEQMPPMAVWLTASFGGGER